MSTISYGIKAFGPIIKANAWFTGDILGAPSAAAIEEALREDGLLGPDYRKVAENGFEVCCTAIARVADGSFVTCSSGSCTYHNDLKTVIFARGAVYSASHWSIISSKAEPGGFAARYLGVIAALDPVTDAKWAAEIESFYTGADAGEVRDFFRVCKDVKEALGALPPGFEWVKTQLPKWRKPLREAARLRRREADAEAWATLSSRGNSRRVDARLGDLAKWEDFIRPRRWTF